MWLLVDSLKRTNNELEALENNEIFGRIVVEDDETVTLCETDSNKVLLIITDKHEIDILNGDKRHSVTRKDILTVKDSFNNTILLFAGLKAFVRDRDITLCSHCGLNINSNESYFRAGRNGTTFCSVDCCYKAFAGFYTRQEVKKTIVHVVRDRH